MADTAFDAADRAEKWEGQKADTLRVIDPFTLQGKTVPERLWIVPEWIPWYCTTALYGNGGEGKSLLAMMLGTAAATGKFWLGQKVTPVKTLGFFCEDTIDELHRRQEQINRAYRCDYSDLGNMSWYSGVGEDNTLMDFDDNSAGKLTALYDRVERKAVAFGAQLAIIDTAADTFGGNENARGEVRRFINALTRLALKIDGAVLLCAHPSVAGMVSGRGDGGNTAWNNTVRSRLYLHRPQEKEGQNNTDLRILSRKKANYARSGDELALVWQDGVFALQAPAGDFNIVDTITRQNRERHAEECFLKAINDFEIQGRNLSSSNRSGNYAPKMMLNNSHCKGFIKKDMQSAMERLFNSGVIKEESYGRPSNQTKKIVRIGGECHVRNGRL